MIKYETLLRKESSFIEIYLKNDIGTSIGDRYKLNNVLTFSTLPRFIMYPSS